MDNKKRLTPVEQGLRPQLWNYLRSEKKRVEGWFQRTDAEIYGALLGFQRAQGIRGACAEIGVHHGKSFIPLCLALEPTELALCIDLFGDQARNLDASGAGSRSVFAANLKAFGVDANQVRFYEGSSEDVTPAYVADSVGPVRFFSVDGGHWSEIVQSDLRLAEKCLSADGVIALDDYCRAEWPDVTYGYSLWQAGTDSDIVPFAVGSNKLYLCRRQRADACRAALRSPYLDQYRGKSYKTHGTEIDCYRIEPVAQDEETLGRALVLGLKMFRPDLVLALRRLRQQGP